METTIIIGIDVAKEKLAIWNNATQMYQEIDNNVRAIGAFLKKTMCAHTSIKVILEPTGGYEKKLVQAYLIYLLNIIFMYLPKILFSQDFFFKQLLTYPWNTFWSDDSSRSF